MAIPAFSEMYNIILQSLKDGNVHTNESCREYVKSQLNLSEEELAETVPSGQIKWINRFDWSKFYLKKAGLFINPKRGQYQITERGSKLLAENVEITNALLIERFPEYAAFMNRSSVSSETPTDFQSPENSKETPEEIFENSHQEITAALSDELLTAVLNMSPSFFESLVVKLMEAMGYGGYEGAGFVTKSSGDGGVDGVIYEDKLGFNLIYIQAKRWSPDTVISRPEIQKFMGALAGPPKIEKGLYITTAKFSKEAKTYADAQHIILVDGKKLTELMIEFDVGVSTQKIYKIKRVDNDFFNEQ